MCGILALAIIVVGTIVTRRAYAQGAGSLDTTFGSKGLVTVNFSSAGFVVPDAIALQSNGDILVLVQAGYTANEVLRFTTTGDLDTTFGTKGVATLPYTLSASMTLQSNGQILIAGVVSTSSGSNLGILRLNTNGTVDSTFGNDGLATASLGGRGTGVGEVVLVQTNGDIFLGAQLEPTGRNQPFQTMLARFSSNGKLDSTFGSGGISVATGSGGCTALAELSNGDYLVVNAQGVAEFSPNGTALTTITEASILASNGSSLPSTPSVFQSNGDFLFGTELFVGEESRAHNSSAEVLRYTQNGTADSTFVDPTFHYIGAGGSGIEATVNALAVQSNGYIVVVGNQTTYAQSGDTTVNGLARLTPSGDLDTTFGSGGTVTNSVPSTTEELSGVVIQTNGNIVTIGIANNDTDLTLERYLGS
jgi:uncharacterized delta-60 repeat protein